MLPFFIFKEVNSSDYLIVNKLPAISKPEKDIEKIEVPGRDGFLTQDLGSYRGTTKTVECSIKDLTNRDFICSWLTGSEEVIFSNELDRKYKATIINKIDLDIILREFRKFIIQFDCQPFGYKLDNEMITMTEPGILTNTGTHRSKPVITVYGTGTIDLILNGQTIHLTNVVDYITIDCELVDCYKGTTLKNSNMQGEFPFLEPGENNINFSGTVIKIEIIPNYNYL
ncbi:MAG: distal tail protein Dit [Bacteroidales bacterium]